MSINYLKSDHFGKMVRIGPMVRIRTTLAAMPTCGARKGLLVILKTLLDSNDAECASSEEMQRAMEDVNEDIKRKTSSSSVQMGKLCIHL